MCSHCQSKRLSLLGGVQRAPNARGEQTEAKGNEWFLSVESLLHHRPPSTQIKNQTSFASVCFLDCFALPCSVADNRRLLSLFLHWKLGYSRSLNFESVAFDSFRAGTDLSIFSRWHSFLSILQKYYIQTLFSPPCIPHASCAWPPKRRARKPRILPLNYCPRPAPDTPTGPPKIPLMYPTNWCSKNTIRSSNDMSSLRKPKWAVDERDNDN